METTRKGAFLRLATLIVLAGALGMLVLAVLCRDEQHVGIGDEIVHEEFGFRVVAVEGHASSAVPERRHVVVHLVIENHAQRVPFDLDNWIPVLVDATGRTYEPRTPELAELEVESEGRDRSVGFLERGASTKRRVGYEVQADAVDLRLEIRWGGPLVDLIENLVFGERDIALGDVAALPASTPRIGANSSQ